MIVYHWTTREKAEAILKNGLRKDSFICRNSEDWRGEVCLGIKGLCVDWEKRDAQAIWQAVTHKIVESNNIFILGELNALQ